MNPTSEAALFTVSQVIVGKPTAERTATSKVSFNVQKLSLPSTINVVVVCGATLGVSPVFPLINPAKAGDQV